MKNRLRQPDVWFLTALLALTVAGTVLLTLPGTIDAETRRLSYSRHYWQAAFDSMSATCGVGLLTYSFQDDYTAQGRWLLSALGVSGAILFVGAVTHATRRMRTGDSLVRVPHPLVVIAVFLAVQAAAVGALVLGREVGGSDVSKLDSVWNSVAAFSSLGWSTESAPRGAAWPIALIAWVAALGWPVWLLIIPRLSRRYVSRRAALATFGAYGVVLVLAALLISAFESPRGGVGRSGPNETLCGQPFKTRFVRGLVQTAAASGAGIPTEPLAERDVTAGTKMTLSGLLLLGGLRGSATGGVQWPLFLWAVAGGATALGALGRASPAPDFARWMHAGLACVCLLAMLALVVGLGLLLLENWTASSYQSPPGFADAFLDACSVVAGGNLSSDLAGAVTSRNLLSGIRQSANLYQYGMTWLMLAMLAGRMLPLVVLRRLADARRAEGGHRRAVVG